MPSRNIYHLTWVSLTLDMGYLHGCYSKARPLLLTLDEGYLLMAASPDLECGVGPLGPPAPHAAADLRHRVAPLSHCPDLGHGAVFLGLLN